MPAATVLLLAASLASGSLDADHVALGRAMADDVQGVCSASQAKEVVRTAGISTLGMRNGRRVVLAEVHGACICGNVNCPYYVLRLDPREPAVLLSTFAYDLRPIGNASPLPNLRETAHDSALVSEETIDAFRDGKYVPVSSERVRSDNGERKPNAVPVRFTPGTSSAVLRGTVSEGWYDEYELVAARGQRVTIAGPPGLFYSLAPRVASKSLDLRPGVPAVLPADGAYLLQIAGNGDGSQAYRATVTIR